MWSWASIGLLTALLTPGFASENEPVNAPPLQLPKLMVEPIAYAKPVEARRCLLPGAGGSGGAFAEPLQNARGDLAIEVIVDRPSEPILPIAQALERAGLSATFLVAEADAKPMTQSLRLLEGSGHEVGLLFDPMRNFGVDRVELLDRIDIARYWRHVRDARKRLRKVSGRAIRVVAVTDLPRALEIALDGSTNVSTVLLLSPDADGAPRHIVGVDGQVGRAVVLSGGPYGQACPVGAELPAWTAAAMDRVSLTLLRASTRFARPIVRVTLAQSRWSAEAEGLLTRYRTEVLAPGQVQVALARTLTSGIGGVPTQAVRQEPVVAGMQTGRPVDLTEVSSAARVLAAGGTLPRELPSELNLTEAYLALVRVLARERPPARVHLWRLEPPAEAAPSLLPADGVELPVEAVRALAKTLEPLLLGQVPGYLEVDGRLLTAAEFLCAMGLALEAPLDGVIHVEPSFSPEPYAPGLGWGISSGD